MQIAENITLLFLPLYSHELNPAELIWLNMKRKTTNIIYKLMDKLKMVINNVVKKMINETFILSICSFDYFFPKLACYIFLIYITRINLNLNKMSPIKYRAH